MFSPTLTKGIALRAAARLIVLRSRIRKQQSLRLRADCIEQRRVLLRADGKRRRKILRADPFRLPRRIHQPKPEALLTSPSALRLLLKPARNLVKLLRTVFRNNTDESGGKNHEGQESEN